MYALKIVNCYLVSRNPHYPIYLCSSLYRVEKKVYSRMRTMLLLDYKYPNNKEMKMMQGNLIYQELHATPKQHMLTTENLTDQVLSILKTTRMEEMSHAPQPVFWYSVAGLLPFLGPPLSFLIFGYSPMLATMQLTFAAILTSFIGGMKWGYTLDNKDDHPTWDNLGWSVIPLMFGWFSMIMPQTIGILLATGGILLSGFVDLTCTPYPAWFKSIRLFLTLPAFLSLLITFFLSLFH